MQKVNIAKPHHKAKKMKNQTEMQNHATIKPKMEKNHHNITISQSKKRYPSCPVQCSLLPEGPT